MIFNHLFTLLAHTHIHTKQETTTKGASTSTATFISNTTVTSTAITATKKIQQTRSIQIRKTKSGTELETLEITSQEATHEDKVVVQLQSLMREYNSLYRDIERGTRRIHSIWENIVNEDVECCDVGNWEMQCEIAPSQQNQICSILSKIISIENSVLNRFDDLQNFIDTLCKADRSYSLNSPCKIFKNDEDPLDHLQVIQLFKFDTKTQKFPSALELHEFLQVNEHIDRIMNAYDMITKVMTVVSRNCPNGHSEQSIIGHIHKKFLELLQKFEATILRLNKCLKLN